MPLGDFIPLEPEIVNGMSALAGVNINSRIIDLGCGDGSTMDTIISYGVKPENVFGVEINTDLFNIALSKGLNVVNDDLFNLNYSTYDVVFFWFNLSVELNTLMDKLYAELKNNKKVICMFDNRRQFRNEVYVPEESYLLPNVTWQPDSFNEMQGQRFYLYVR